MKYFQWVVRKRTVRHEVEWSGTALHPGWMDRRSYNSNHNNGTLEGTRDFGYRFFRARKDGRKGPSSRNNRAHLHARETCRMTANVLSGEILNVGIKPNPRRVPRAELIVKIRYRDLRDNSSCNAINFEDARAHIARWTALSSKTMTHESKNFANVFANFVNFPVWNIPFLPQLRLRTALISLRALVRSTSINSCSTL